MNFTLPTDSAERKEYPLLRGFLNYFPAAVAKVANLSLEGNKRHNPGEELHHARGKSTDHGDCILRHTMDLEDAKAAFARGEYGATKAILQEATQRAWRAMADLQELCERYDHAPLAPGARTEATELAKLAEDAAAWAKKAYNPYWTGTGTGGRTATEVYYDESKKAWAEFNKGLDDSFRRISGDKDYGEDGMYRDGNPTAPSS